MKGTRKKAGELVPGDRLVGYGTVARVEPSPELKDFVTVHFEDGERWLWPKVREKALAEESLGEYRLQEKGSEGTIIGMFPTAEAAIEKAKELILSEETLEVVRVERVARITSTRTFRVDRFS